MERRYGVAIFFGFSQRNELDILDDLLKRGIIIGEKKVSDKQQYETESFHFEYDPSAPTPRIYNDFFSAFAISTLTSPFRMFSSLQVTITPTQTGYRACHRPVHCASHTRDCRF